MSHWLHVVRGPRLVTTVPLGELPFTLGRSRDADLTLDGEGVPAIHGYLQVGPDGRLVYQPEPEGEAARVDPGTGLEVGPFQVFLEKRGTGEGEVIDLLLDLLPRLWSAEEDEVLGVILEALLGAFQAEWGAFLRLEDDGGAEVLASAGKRSVPGDAPSRTVLKKVAEADAPVLAVEVAEAPELAEAASIPAEVRSVIAARFSHGDDDDLVYLESPVSERRYSPAEHRLLSRLAELAADHLSRAQAARRVEEDRERLAELHRIEMSREHDLAHIVGKSARMQEVFDLVRQAAESEVTTLVLGESGTGKELVAKAIHNLSARRTRPFVAVNCAALPADLVESELFGHVRGAFSGATRTRLGRFEMANGGTLFLDELAELPLPQQVKLLRALQERTIQRLGEGKDRPVDVHLVAATNANLQAMVADGSFREDLYFRVSVFGIPLPPLRDRMEDLPHLIQHFVKQFNPELRRNIRHVHPDALRILQGHRWPGNVRELRNVVQQGMVRSEGDTLTPESLSLMGSITLEPKAAAPPAPLDEDLPDNLDDARALWERRFMIRALERFDGNVVAAAENLGVSRANMYRKCSLYEIDPAAYRK